MKGNEVSLAENPLKPGQHVLSRIDLCLVKRNVLLYMFSHVFR